MSLLTQLSSYTGMLLVGLCIPILIKQKKQMAIDYNLVGAEEVFLYLNDRLIVIKPLTLFFRRIVQQSYRHHALSEVIIQQ